MFTSTSASPEGSFNHIQVHPLALLQHRNLNDAELSKTIEGKIIGFEKEVDFFVSKLAYGIAKVAASFYPEKVIVRFSDFKSKEYFNIWEVSILNQRKKTQ